jgi:hypothetical protein
MRANATMRRARNGNGRAVTREALAQQAMAMQAMQQQAMVRSPMAPSAIEAVIRTPGAPPAMATIDPSMGVTQADLIQDQLILDEANKLTWYGLDSGDVLIPANTARNVVAEPQRQVVPERIIIPGAIGGDFIVNFINVGVEPVFSSNDPVPALVFGTDQTNAPFRAVLLRPGQRFVVNVTNIAGDDRRFRGGVQARLA